MAITVISNTNTGNPMRDAGVTTGNEFIYRVDPTKEIRVTGLATSTGAATVYYSTDPYMNVPTDFSTLNISSLGSFTDDIGETLPTGVVWVGIDVASGTWTNYIKEV